MKKYDDRTILGIDPGVTGALAEFYRGALVAWHDIPSVIVPTHTTVRRLDLQAFTDLVKIIIRDAGCPDDIVVYLEYSQPMPGQGVSSTFHYGRTCGIIEGVLAACRITHVVKVVPAKWKRRLGLVGLLNQKSSSIQCAKSLYPSADLTLKKHHNRAEAILIGRYGCLAEGLIT